MVITVRLPRERSLHLGETTRVMGIVNCTPDSFFSDSRARAVDQAVARARDMINAGADMLDIGGESSRPGSAYVDSDQEIDRVAPVIEAIRSFSDIPLSVDTRKADVARAAVIAGADIVNDISALRDDPKLLQLVVERCLPVILMHMRGTPRTMQQSPHYDDAVAEVGRELLEFADSATAAGVDRSRIILDPGIGFGKRIEDNVVLLGATAQFKRLGYPVLIGASRKAFIGHLIAGDDDAPRPVEQRLAGTLAVHLWSAGAGADILRVHDVRETVEALKLFSILSNSRGGER